MRPAHETPAPEPPKTAASAPPSFQMQPLAEETSSSAPEEADQSRATATDSNDDVGPTQTSAPGGQSDEERAILRTLDKLRQHLDPGKVDWGKAGYDFGEGFKGPDARRR